jgi:hypothetical protein
MELGESGPELYAVFIGSSTCGATEREGFGDVVEGIKLQLRGRAEQAGMRFAVAGAATDWHVEPGLAFLRHFGEWDEVLVGRNWLNAAAVRYLWRDIPGRPAVPQVILLRRHVTVSDEGIEISEEQLVARKLGVFEIEDWYENGSPF